MRTPPGCGFTLIELLVVIAIIAVLIDPSHPRGTARESRADAVQNNLKRSSVSRLHNYHDALHLAVLAISMTGPEAIARAER